MDNLRVLLMILGIFIIAGIYLWGVGFDHRKATHNLKKRRKDLEEPILETPVIKPREEELDFTDVFRRQGGLFRDEEADPPQEAACLDSGSKPAVIVLYVTAPSGFSFSGDMVREALYSAGLSYGDMRIFHHYGVGHSVTTENVFSVANIHEPGTFDLKNMEALQTEGLVIFMELPAPIDAAVGFEHMLSTAQRLAEVLKGHVRDEKREHLTPETIESIRSYVAGINV